MIGGVIDDTMEVKFDRPDSSIVADYGNGLTPKQRQGVYHLSEGSEIMLWIVMTAVDVADPGALLLGRDRRGDGRDERGGPKRLPVNSCHSCTPVDTLPPSPIAVPPALPLFATGALIVAFNWSPLAYCSSSISYAKYTECQML
jgi:hypothetical protein